MGLFSGESGNPRDSVMAEWMIFLSCLSSFFVSDFYIRESENYRIPKINLVWGIKKKGGGGVSC